MNPLSDDDRTLGSQKTTPDTLQGNLLLEKARKLTFSKQAWLKELHRNSIIGYIIYMRSSNAFLQIVSAQVMVPLSKPQPRNFFVLPDTEELKKSPKADKKP